jgi:hypothetical protein
MLPCFVALDVSPKYIAPNNIRSCHNHCNVFVKVVVAESYTLARRMPTLCYTHSINTFPSLDLP